MKTVWKPLDVMGLRLYKVAAAWPAAVTRAGHSFQSRTEQHVVAAQSPREAARIVADQYRNLEEERRPYCTGHALNVCQPESWYEKSVGCVAPLDCKHDRTRTLQSGEGCGAGHSFREHVSLCLDCGEFHVSATRDGQSFQVRFGVCCDDDLRGAANYMRGKAAAEEAVRTAKRGDA